jgi:enolase
MTQRAQSAMGHEVGIAADGAREVKIVLARESEVAEILGSVTREALGAQHQIGEETLFGTAFHLTQDALEVLALGMLEIGGDV